MGERYVDPMDADRISQEAGIKLEPSEDTRVAIATDLAGLATANMAHNFPGTAAEKWRMIALAENDSVSGSEYTEGANFGLKYWYMQRIKMEDQKSGEITEPIRTVIVDGDGIFLHFVSDGIAKSLAKIIQVFGIGPYDPPIPVEIKEIKTRNKMKMLTLIPAKE